jgi:flagellar hook-basal body complex protein FliE
MSIPAITSAGSEWQLGSIDQTQPTQGASGGFGDMLGKSIQSLQATQDDAAQQSMDLATGKATDPTSVVMSVERAQLSMQLASQLRNKAVEAVQTIFQTQA